MTKFDKTDVSLLNNKLKKQDQYLKAKKVNTSIVIMYGFSGSMNNILRICINESEEITFQLNGFNIFTLSSIAILQKALKAIADWNEVELSKL